MPAVRYHPYNIEAFFRPVDGKGDPIGPWAHLKMDLKRISDRVAQCLFTVPEDAAGSKVVEVKILWDTGLEPLHLMSECKDLGTGRVVSAPKIVYTNTTSGVHERINPADPTSNRRDQAITVVAMHKRGDAALRERVGYSHKLEFTTRVYEEEAPVALTRSICQPPPPEQRLRGGGCAGAVVGGRRMEDVKTSGPIRGRLTDEVALQIFCHFRFENDDEAEEGDLPESYGGVHLSEEKHKILEGMRGYDSSD